MFGKIIKRIRNLTNRKPKLWRGIATFICKNKTDLFIVIILLLLSVYAGKGLFKYNIYYAHDMVHHISRGYDAAQALIEGHFPLRWAGSLNYKCGAAVYNFFYPLIYYLLGLMGIISGGKIIFSIKLINFFSLIIGTVFFYLWLNKDLKNKLAAFSGAILYLFAPYRFLLVFVRSSPEYLAYAIFPIVLYFYSLAMDEKSKVKSSLLFFVSSVAGGMLAISHNFTVMFLMPILAVYLIMKIIKEKKPRFKIIMTGFSFIASFGLGAFFIGPAIFEKNSVKLGTVSTINFREHFPTLNQVIKSRWDYHYSAPGTADDGMSFMLGYAHWVVLIILGTALIYLLIVKKRSIQKIINDNIWISALFVSSVVSIFLILPQSLFIWEKIPLLQSIQFSWRLLGIAVFFISALGAYFINSVKNKKIKYLFAIIICTLAIIGNRNHMLPQPIMDEEAYLFDDYNRLHYHRYSTTTFGDDIISSSAPEACYFDTPLVSYNDEKVEHFEIHRGFTYGDVVFDSGFDKEGGDSIRLGLGYYPGAYKITVNGKPVDYKDCSGLVCVPKENFNDGLNHLSWKIVQTPVQIFFNYISLLVIFIWALLLWRLLSEKTFKNYFPVTIVMGLFLFLRLINIDERLLFNWDQERDAFAAKEILSGNFTLLGPRVLGPMGFYLPPYFFYLISPFYFLGGYSVYSIILFLIFYLIFFGSASLYTIGKLFNKQTAFIFLIIWSVLPVTIGADTIVWNPLAIPLFSLLFVFLVKNCFDKKDIKHHVMAFLAFWLASAFHVQFLAYISFIALIIYFGKKNNIAKNIFLFIFTGFVVFLPIILFDLRHNFLNMGLLLNLEKPVTVGNWFDVWINFSKSLVGFNTSPVTGVIIYIIIIAITLYNYLKEKNDGLKKVFLGFLLTFILTPILFSIYKARPSEYYFNYLLVGIVLNVSVITFHLIRIKKYWILLLTSPVLFNIVLSEGEIIKPKYNSLYYKERTVILLSDVVHDRDFNVSLDMDNGEEAGFTYILDSKGILDAVNPKAPLVELTSPPKKKASQMVSGNYGIFVPDAWIDQEVNKSP